MAIFNKKTTIFVLLDAFRWDYINEKSTPFLFTLIQKGIYVRKLVSTAGFTQRSAVFTGTYDDTRNQLTAFIFDKEHSPFKFLENHKKLYSLDKRRNLPLLSEGFPFSYLKKWYCLKQEQHKSKTRNWINQEAKKYAAHAPSARIPFRLLSHFSCAEDATPIWDTVENSIESFFGIIKKEGLAYEYIMYPLINCDDERTLELTRKRVQTGADTYFITFTETDSLCHRFGTSTFHREKAVNEIDQKMAEINKVFEKSFDNIHWVIFGDHGMADVIELFDGGNIILNAANKYRLQLGTDFLMFLDSTMIRLWYLNKSAEGFIKSIFHDVPIFQKKGQVIDKNIAKQHRIPLNHSPCGDTIWWAHSGVIVSPDYFFAPHSPPKGMHGYNPNSEDGKGFALINGANIMPRTIEQANLVDICPTFCDILKIPYPRNNEGQSLICNKN